MEDNEEIKDPLIPEEEPVTPDELEERVIADDDEEDDEKGTAPESDVEITVDLRSPKETKSACPYCYQEQDRTKIGKNICSNPECGRTFFIQSEVRVYIFLTLDEIETRQYNKILAHINNKLRDKNYVGAYQYCLKAEEIAPGEPATWEYFALTGFLLEITRNRNERKPTLEIIKIIKLHLDKCKDHGITEERYEELLVEIANRLFNLEKARIKSFRTYYRDDTGKEKWTRQSLFPLLTLLRSFEICYSLYKDPLFLEEYVNELTKPYKWLVKSLDDGEIRNTQLLGNFNAKEKLKSLVRKIQEKKPGYQPPVIQEERFEILDSEDLAQLTVTPEPNAEQTTGINILSIE